MSQPTTRPTPTWERGFPRRRYPDGKYNTQADPSYRIAQQKQMRFATVSASPGSEVFPPREVEVLALAAKVSYVLKEEDDLALA